MPELSQPIDFSPFLSRHRGNDPHTRYMMESPARDVRGNASKNVKALMKDTTYVKKTVYRPSSRMFTQETVWTKEYKRLVYLGEWETGMIFLFFLVSRR